MHNDSVMHDLNNDGSRSLLSADRVGMRLMYAV